MALFQEKDNMLFNVWSWVGCMDQLLTSGRAQLGGLDFSYQGLHRVLQGLSENASISYHDTLSTVYTSPQRKLALSICGWLGPKELELEIAQLESDGLFEKAAFLSFLHSDLQRCIKSLLLSKDRNHHLVCGTIAGFTPSHPNPSWVNLCLQLSKETASPELCAVFTFFATSNWQDVIQSELKMREKLLIALRYLNDTALVEYVDAEGRQTIQKGSLDGLLFTGLSTEAVDIFSEYVDRTGDIQTASLVLSIVVPKRFKDTKVEEWIESYRKYLDQLQLFHIRAMFDIQHAKHAEGEFVIPPQVSISCDYCNQSISHSSSATLSKGNLPSMSPKVKVLFKILCSTF
ncbi:hypothetical protein HMI56_004637 [Coelomomyces lativittatus]|nr:hypothetical protein HMI56_004637 [Coelomomyces lativittatus]